MKNQCVSGFFVCDNAACYSRHTSILELPESKSSPGNSLIMPTEISCGTLRFVNDRGEELGLRHSNKHVYFLVFLL